MNKCECNICGEIFNNVKIKANHIRWKHQTKEFYSKMKENISNSLQLIFNSKLGEIIDFNVICHRCGKGFIVKERSKQFPIKTEYFCSRRCANKRKHSIECKNKIRESVITFQNLNPDKCGCMKKTPNKTYNCLYCKNDFLSKKNKRSFCTKTCQILFRKLNMSEFRKYKSDCDFKFNLHDYPNEFDFELIKKHGWYSAKNRGNNLGGVSRDHMISVRYGFENNIDPKYIRHPANCKLLIHNENVSKGKKSSISLNELLKRIEEWDKKYFNMGGIVIIVAHGICNAEASEHNRVPPPV